MKRSLSFFVLISLCLGLCACTDTSSQVPIPAQTPWITTAETTTITMTTTAEAQKSLRENLIYDADTLPEDTVYAVVRPSEGRGGAAIFVPEEQEAWKKAWEEACQSLVTAEVKAVPWEETLPLELIWCRDGKEESFLLGQEKLWRLDEDIQTADGAKALYDLAAKLYRDLEINPVNPAEILHIQCAKLTVHNRTQYLSDPEQLARMEALLSKSRSGTATGCTFDTLALTLDSGRELVLALANDSCDVWMSDGVYYQLDDGAGGVREIYDMFGLEPTGENFYGLWANVSAQEVETFARQVRQAILDGDWKTLADQCLYPVLVDGESVQDRETFLRKMQNVRVREAFLEAVEKEPCRNMLTNSDGSAFGAGEVWISCRLDEDNQPQMGVITLTGVKE